MDSWIKFGKAWVKIFAYQILDILTNKLLLFHSNNPYLWQSHQFEVSLHSWWIWPNVRHFEIIFIIVIVHITPQKFSKLKVMYYFFSLDGGPPLLSRIPTSSAKETSSLKTTFWTTFCFVFVVQFSFLDLIKLLKRVQSGKEALNQRNRRKSHESLWREPFVNNRTYLEILKWCCPFLQLRFHQLYFPIFRFSSIVKFQFDFSDLTQTDLTRKFNENFQY